MLYVGAKRDEHGGQLRSHHCQTELSIYISTLLEAVKTEPGVLHRFLQYFLRIFHIFSHWHRTVMDFMRNAGVIRNERNPGEPAPDWKDLNHMLSVDR